MTPLFLAWAVLLPLQEDPDAAVEAFQKAFREAADDDSRILAVETLAKAQPAKGVAKLAPLLGAGSSRVRGAAAKALGEFADHRKPASTALLNGLAVNTKDTPVLDAIFQALVRLQEPTSALGLPRFFDDKDFSLAKGSVTAVGKLGHSGAVDALIAVLARTEKLLKANSGDAVEVTDPNTGASVVARPDTDRHARAKALHAAATESLRQLTGVSHPSSDAWTAWWAQNRSRFPAPK